MLSNILWLNVCNLKIIHILHPRYHPKIMGHTLKNKQKNNGVCILGNIRLIILKMKMKMKKRSYRYDINRPRSAHGHKYSKFKKWLNRRVRDAILLGGVNSGQTSIKSRDLACDAEPPLLKNRNCLTMQLKVKYHFLTLFAGANFYIYELPEGLGTKKTLAHGISTPKNSQTGEEIVWIFTHFHGVMRVQSPTCNTTRKFH